MRRVFSFGWVLVALWLLVPVAYAETAATTTETASAETDDADALEKSAKAAAAAKDWGLALTLWDRYLAQKPESAYGFSMKGWALRELHRIDEAVAAYRKSTELAPNSVRGWGGLCWTFILSNQQQAARQNCEKAVAIDPTSYAALVNLGHTYLLQGNTKTAQIWYQKTLLNLRDERALKEGPLDDFDLFISKSWQVAASRKAKAWFEKEGPAFLVSIAPVNKLLAEASAADVANDYVRSIALREQALPQLLTLLGEKHLLIATTRKALNEALEQQGDQLFEQAHYAEALALYQQVLAARKKPNALDSAKIGDSQNKIAHTTGRLHPKQAKGIKYLENEGAYLIKNERFEQAESTYRELVQLTISAGGMPAAAGLNGLATSLWLQGKYDEAQQQAESALKIAQQTPNFSKHFEATLHSNLAIVLRSLKKNPEALREYFLAQTIVEENGSSPGEQGLLWSNIGNILRELGHAEEARQAYSKAVDRLSKDNGTKLRTRYRSLIYSLMFALTELAPSAKDAVFMLKLAHDNLYAKTQDDSPERLWLLAKLVVAETALGGTKEAEQTANNLWTLLVTSTRIDAANRFSLLTLMADYWVVAGKADTLRTVLPTIRVHYEALDDQQKELQAKDLTGLIRQWRPSIREHFAAILLLAGDEAAYRQLYNIPLSAYRQQECTDKKVWLKPFLEGELRLLAAQDLILNNLDCRLSLLPPGATSAYIAKRIAERIEAIGIVGNASEATSRALAILKLLSETAHAEKIEPEEINAREALANLLEDIGKADEATKLRMAITELGVVRQLQTIAKDPAQPRLTLSRTHGKSHIRVGGDYLLSRENIELFLGEASTGKHLFKVKRAYDRIADISPNGAQIAYISDDTIQVIDIATYRVVHQLPISGGAIEALAFSKDSALLATASWSGIHLWRLSDGKRFWRKSSTSSFESSHILRFSRDGKHLFVGRGTEQTGTIEKYDINTGDLLATSPRLQSANISQTNDGKTLIVFGKKRSADNPSWLRLLDAETLAPLHTFSASIEDTTCSSDLLSPDGQSLAIPRPGVIEIWDSGQWQRRSTHITSSTCFAWRDNTTLLALNSGDVEIISLDGTPTQETRGQVPLRVAGTAFSKDGKTLLVRAGKHFMTLQLPTGEVINSKIAGWLPSQDMRRLLPEADPFDRYWESSGRKYDGLRPLNIDVSIDDNTLLEGIWLSLYAKQTRGEIPFYQRIAWSVSTKGGSPNSRFSGNGKYIGTINGARLDIRASQSGKPVWTIEIPQSGDGQEIEIHHIFPLGGNTFLLGDSSGTSWIADVGSRQLTRRWQNSMTAYMRFWAYAEDAELILTGSTKDSQVIRADTGEVLWNQSVTFGSYTNQTISPDGSLVAATGDDGTIHLYSGKDGKYLLKIHLFENGDWAAIDPEGRFDASRGGEVDGLHWVIGATSVALSQLKERYFEPGLVPRTLGFNQEALRPVAAFTAPKLFPKVETRITEKSGKSVLIIKLTNQGGGIGAVQVRINGKEIVADARGKDFDQQAPSAQLELDLSDVSLRTDQKNEVEVVARNAEGYLASRGAKTLLPASAIGSNKAAAPPTLHAIVSGISHYANPSMNLVFPGKDAADIAQSLQLAGKRLFGTERVDVHLFSDHEGTSGETRRPPSRQALKDAFAAVAAKARPEDLLVVYLAGHGVMSSGDGADYYYLTPEARTTDFSDPAIRNAYGISSSELTEWIKAIPALKQVMVLDTCAAGGAAEKLNQARAMSSDQIRALDRLKDRTGFHVLMGAAADKVSYESSQYGQGLLTYAILQGMKGAALREGEYVDVSALFQHAADQVPQLAQSIGGIQKPLISAPRGASFDIGQMNSEDKVKVPLATRRPMILRGVFQDQDRPVDKLGIGRTINRLLKDESARPGQGKVVYVDAEELPGAYLLAGRYQRLGSDLSLSAILYRDDDEIATFKVRGALQDQAQISRQVVDWAMAQMIRRQE